MNFAKVKLCMMPKSVMKENLKGAKKVKEGGSLPETTRSASFVNAKFPWIPEYDLFSSDHLTELLNLLVPGLRVPFICYES